MESQKQEAEKLAEMQRQLQESAQKGQEVAQGDGTSEEDRLALSKQREQEAMEELNRAIAQARLQGQQAMNLPVDTDTLTKQNEKNLEVSDEKENNDAPQEVVKKIRVTSDYFNTICENEKSRS